MDEFMEWLQEYDKWIDNGTQWEQFGMNLFLWVVIMGIMFTYVLITDSGTPHIPEHLTAYEECEKIIAFWTNFSTHSEAVIKWQKEMIAYYDYILNLPNKEVISLQKLFIFELSIFVYIIWKIFYPQWLKYLKEKPDPKLNLKKREQIAVYKLIKDIEKRVAEISKTNSEQFDINIFTQILDYLWIFVKLKNPEFLKDKDNLYDIITKLSDFNYYLISKNYFYLAGEISHAQVILVRVNCELNGVKYSTRVSGRHDHTGLERPY